MLDLLLALTQTLEFEESGGFRFVSVERTSGGLQLRLALIPGGGGDEQPWCIQCVGAHGHRLHGEFAQSLEVASEHPVLLPFTEPVTDLYFSSPAPNPPAAVGALWERHRQLVGSWLPFEQFVNAVPKGLAALLAASSGQLAAGPVSLMQAYAEVLTEHGVRSSMLPPHPPRRWDGERWVGPASRLHALVFGTSYVVAERFDAGELAG